MKKDFSDMFIEVMLWTMLVAMVLAMIFGKLLGMTELAGIFIGIVLIAPFTWAPMMIIDGIIEEIRHKNSNK